MGSRSSTRWGTTVVRQDTAPLLKLDISRLRHLGALRPGAVTNLTWCRGRLAGNSIAVIVDQHAADALVLEYLLPCPGGDFRPVRESIALTTTPCTFGGNPTWFRCPRCHSRRGVLFFLYGQFRCRSCHDVAYTSTRERK
jgi:hypothetical protein